MLNNPKVSVIIPVYNVEKFLKDCLDSIISQTLKDIEIICIDDGSTDNSKRILLEYSYKDKRITVLQQLHLGAGAARNHGIKVAKGKYLAFLDADDFFDKEMLEMCYMNLEKNGSDVVIFLAKQFDNKSKKIIEMPWSLRINNCPSCCFKPKEIKKSLFNSFQNWPWNKLFRRSFVIENTILFQEIPRTNDMAFVCEALALAKKISIIEQYFVYYRVNTGTSLQQTNDNSPVSFWEACIETKKRLQSKGLYNEYQQTLINSVVSGALYNFRSVKTWNAYKKIFCILKYEMEKEFDVSKLNRNYFYDINAYNQLSEIMRLDLDEYLYKKMIWWKNVKNQVKDHKKFKKLINSCFDCYKQYGMIYTIKKICYHLGMPNNYIKK